MKRQSLKPLALSAAAVLIAFTQSGCQKSAAPLSSKTALAAPSPAEPAPQNPAAPTAAPTQAASKHPIKDAVEALLQKEAASAHPLFPEGTKLRKAKLEDGVATLDFSAEFDRLANMGDTTEANAQKALCRAVADIPGVEKLRVTVENRPFDSQMTDWNTPFPVRAEGEYGTRTVSNSMKSEDRRKVQEPDRKPFGSEQ